MKSQKNHSHRKKPDWDIIIKFAFVQLVILVCLTCALLDSFPIGKDDMTCVEITVEEKFFSAGSRSSPMLIIICNGERYYFRNKPTDDSISARELDELIGVGDTLSLTYYKYISPIGPKKMILAANSGNAVYRNFEEVEKKNQNSTFNIVSIIILFSAIEIFYLAVFLYGSQLLPRSKKRKPKHTKQKYKSSLKK